MYCGPSACDGGLPSSPGRGGRMTAQPTAPTRTGSRVLLQGFFADPSFDYGIRNVLGATAYGVGDVGTVLATAARIIDGDWASWFSAWTDRADHLAALGARRRDARELRGASTAAVNLRPAPDHGMLEAALV